MPITNLPNPGMDFTPLTPLTAEEMDDIVENIEAINNAASMNYSTSEVDTGATWIDGKTIYKKTFHKNIPSASRYDGYSIALGISNLETPVKLEGVRKRSSTTYPEISAIPFCIHMNNSDAIWIDVNIDLSTNELQVACNLSVGYGGVVDDYITFYYTKSS